MASDVGKTIIRKNIYIYNILLKYGKRFDLTNHLRSHF